MNDIDVQMWMDMWEGKSFRDKKKKPEVVKNE